MWALQWTLHLPDVSEVKEVVDEGEVSAGDKEGRTKEGVVEEKNKTE